MVPNSENTSISSFRYADGLRYHNVENARYPLPNGEEELDRLHLQHFMMRYVWQSNFSAPVEHILNREGSKVLDVGCGAGSWVLEMATNHPKIEFTGVDISPLQPSGIKPKNAEFILGNLLTGLPFEDNTFDYVFQRFLVAGIPMEKWPSVISELTRVLKPGGFLELMECTVATLRNGPATIRIFDAVIDMANQKGLDPFVVHKLKTLCEGESQLENVECKENNIFYGVETGNLGKLGIDNIKLGIFQNLKSVLAKILQVSSEEYDEIMNTSVKEMKEFNSYHFGVRVYARKRII